MKQWFVAETVRNRQDEAALDAIRSDFQPCYEQRPLPWKFRLWGSRLYRWLWWVVVGRWWKVRMGTLEDVCFDDEARAAIREQIKRRMHEMG